ncbi:MAG: redox-regulated ATPase YchF [Firmicutes bacterium]|nr:redox-regulated ATPase YchF [Bacillota bacterium]
MKVGIMGLPQVGKTSVFRLLTGNGVTAKGRAGIGVASIPDDRLDRLSEMYRPKKTTYATLTCIDTEAFSPGEGVPRFLNGLQDADALIQVVGGIVAEDPAAQLMAIQEELALVDWGLLDTRLERLRKEGRRVQTNGLELSLLERARSALERGRHLRTMEFSDEERRLLQGYSLYTMKPLIVAVNVDDEASLEEYPGKEEIARWADEQAVTVVPLAAQLEWEVAQLPREDQGAFMRDLGLSELGILRVARVVYTQLGLISFFTVGEDEVRAWTIKQGATARKAAGKIHSDIERGFIRAEVVSYHDLIELGSMAKVKDAGLLRLEGKDYVMADGDVVSFRFNV